MSAQVSAIILTVLGMIVVSVASYQDVRSDVDEIQMKIGKIEAYMEYIPRLDERLKAVQESLRGMSRQAESNTRELRKEIESQ